MKYQKHRIGLGRRVQGTVGLIVGMMCSLEIVRLSCFSHFTDGVRIRGG